MYLHIGGESVIALRDLVAVLDARALKASPEGLFFLEKMRAQRSLVPSDEERTNSYVVTTRGVFASAISATTLKRRAYNPQMMAEWE